MSNYIIAKTKCPKFQNEMSKKNQEWCPIFGWKKNNRIKSYLRI